MLKCFRYRGNGDHNRTGSAQLGNRARHASEMKLKRVLLKLKFHFSCMSGNLSQFGKSYPAMISTSATFTCAFQEVGFMSVDNIQGVSMS